MSEKEGRKFVWAIVVVMVFPSMLPLLSAPSSGITVYSDGSLVIENGEVFEINGTTVHGGEPGVWEQTGNITVRNGGTLIVRNATIRFKQDAGWDGIYGTGDDKRYWMNITDGGVLRLYNATITVATEQIYPYLLFNLYVDNATMISERGNISFPGWFNITNNAVVYLNDTVIQPLPSSLAKATGPITKDKNDDAPRLYIHNSTVFMGNSSYLKPYDVSTTDVPDVYAYPTQFDPDNTVAGSIDDLQKGGGHLTITNGQNLSVSGFTMPSVPGYEDAAVLGFTSAVVECSATTSPYYNGSTNLTWSTDGTQYTNTSIYFSASAPTEQSYDIYSDGLATLEDLTNLHLRFHHNGSTSTEMYVQYRDSTWDTTPNTDTANLTTSDGNMYLVPNGTRMSVYSFTDSAGSPFDVGAATLYVNYTNETGYAATTMNITDQNTGTLYGTLNLPPTTGGMNIVSLDIYALGVNTYQKLQDLNLTLFNPDTNANLSIDRVWIVAQANGTVQMDYLRVKLTPIVAYGIIIDGDSNFTAVDTYLDLDFGQESGDHTTRDVMVVRDKAKVHLYNVTMRKWPSTELKPAIYTWWDSPDANVEIYRWLEVSPVDEVNDPVPGAEVSVRFSPTNKTAHLCQYVANANQIPPVVMEYMNRTRPDPSYYVTYSTYNITGPSGTPVRIPLLTDIINVSTGPNGVPVGKYNVTVEYTNNAGGTSNVSFNATFKSYPNIVDWEDNVFQASPILVGSPLVDLSISPADISFSPLFPMEGDNITLNVTVHNTGTKTCPDGVNVRVYNTEDMSLVGEQNTTGPMVPGGWEILSFTISGLVEGSYVFLVVVDEPDAFHESNETNNNATLAMTVNATSEVGMVSLSLSPSDMAVVGDTVIINGMVTQKGGTHPLNVTIGIYDDGNLLRYVEVTVNQSGGTSPFTLTWTPTTRGEHTISATVDPLGNLTDPNPDNNTLTASITVYDSPYDLIVENSTYIIEQNEVLSISGSVIVRTGGTLIINGTLQINGAGEKLLVVANGSLYVNGGSIEAPPSATAIFNTTGTIAINDCSFGISALEIYTGNTYINGTTANSLTVYGTSNVESRDSTYTSITFTNTSTGKLTNTTTPTVDQNAYVEQYWYLRVRTVDAGGMPIPGATVQVTNMLTPTLDTSGTTDATGNATFTLLGSEWNGTEETFYGSYSVTGVYGTNTSDSTEGVVLDTNKDVTLVFSSVKPDPYIYSLYASTTSPVSGETVTIYAIINNTGPTETTVDILFFIDGNETTGDLIHKETGVHLSPGETKNLSFQWSTTGYPDGAHYVYASLTAPADANTTNNNATLAMTIQPARPDLRVIDMAFYYNGNPVNSGVVGTKVKVNVTLNNSGTADATGTVYVTLVDETTGTTIGTKTVPNFVANTDRYVLFDWTLQLPAGPHDLNVTVDPTNSISELNETNNYLVSTFTVLGKANLTVERVWFNETAPFEGETVTIYAEIANLGEAWANGTIHYAFWDGEVNVGTVITDRNTAINLDIGASIVITTQWNATGAGEHTISFSVDTQDISESTTSDNQISTRIIVYRGGNLDLVIDDNTVVNITSSYYQQGYILIKDNGTLNVVGATLYMRESAPDQYNIIVRDNGTIRFLSGGTLTSNYAITMWLEGNATLVAEDGSFSSQVSVKTTTQDGSTASDIHIRMVDFTLNGVFESASGINVDFIATNTSFYYPIYKFGGNSYGVFTNCRVPYFSLQENAHVTVKAWVRVYVYDANNRPISGAVVEPREYLDPQSVVDGISRSTGVDGSVLMALRTDELYAPPSGSGGVISTFVGNYYINVTFTDVRGDTHYAMAPIDPPLPAYPDSLSQPIPTVRDIEFVLSDVKPDLDPPVSVDDASLPRFNSTIVRTQITNTGISTAYNVLVRFTDLATGEVFNETLVDEIDVGEAVWINVTRTFTEAVFGTHTLEVYVNPPDNNPYYLEEENETNNTGTADVSVFPLSDLVPSTIEFSIDEPAEGDYISIEAILTNDGDVAATFNISCYLDEVGNESHLLGFVEGKYLGAGQSTAPTKVGEWYIPSEGIAGTHTIYVVVDVNGTVWEYDETNNVLSRNLIVYRRADLSINPGSIDVSHREAEDGQVVNITARVENTGEKPASNVVVWFFVDRNENMQYDSQTDEFIQEVTIDTIQPGSVGKASTSWVASTTEPNVTFQIGVVVNPYHTTPPDEYNWTDNQAFTQITVTLLRDLSISFQDVTFLVIDTYNVEMDVMVHVEGQAAEDIHVVFYEDANSNGQMDSGEVFGEKTISGPVEPGAVVPVSATLNVTQNDVMAQYHTVYVAVNPDGAIHEINIANNIMQYPLPDPRPDLQVSNVRFYETPVDGMETTLNFTLINNGLSDSRNVWIAVYDGNITNGTLIWDSGTNKKTWNLSAGTSLEANVTLRLYGAGIHNITVVVNPQMEGHNITIPEFNEKNNLAFNDTVNVTLPPFVIHLYTPGSGAQFTVGGKPITVTGYIYPPPTDTARANIAVFLYRSNGETYYESPPVHPNADGSFYVEIPAPADTDNYYIDVTLSYENATYSLGPGARPVVTLVPPVKETGLPLWAIIAIILVIVIPILAVSMYLYRYGLGRLVECGECGALIPVGSTKCPKCGVEFEKDVAKCSVCGAWIPIDAESCPECGAEFVTQPLTKEEYEEKMRKQYEEFLAPFKEKAREELGIPEGEELTDEQFQEWWKQQPAYISFEDWLAMEEEKRAQVKPVVCPECGSLNPPDATICHKCGVVLKKEKKETTKTPAPPAGPAAGEEKGPKAKEKGAPLKEEELRELLRGEEKTEEPSPTTTTAPPAPAPETEQPPEKKVVKKVVTPPKAVAKKVVVPAKPGEKPVVAKKVVVAKKPGEKPEPVKPKVVKKMVKKEEEEKK